MKINAIIKVNINSNLNLYKRRGVHIVRLFFYIPYNYRVNRYLDYIDLAWYHQMHLINT